MAVWNFPPFPHFKCAVFVFPCQQCLFLIIHSLPSLSCSREDQKGIDHHLSWIVYTRWFLKVPSSSMILWKYELKKDRVINTRMLACDFIGLVRGSIKKKKCSHATKTSGVCLRLGKIKFLEIWQQPKLSGGCIFRVVLGDKGCLGPFHFVK